MRIIVETEKGLPQRKKSMSKICLTMLFPDVTLSWQDLVTSDVSKSRLSAQVLEAV